MNCLVPALKGVTLLGLLSLTCMSPARPETLGVVLAKHQVEVQSPRPSDWKKLITSYASYREAERFVLAYYHQQAYSQQLPNELRLLLVDLDSKSWLQERLSVVGLVPERPNLHLGAIVKILASREHVYIVGHQTPSAALTLVLSRELEVRDLLPGWPQVVTPAGLVVYQHSQVHFAPTRYTQLSMYDPKSKRHSQIYPLEPFQEVRSEHVEKVRAAYLRRGEDWFRNRNHHMNPELFNNHLRGAIEVDGNTHSLAFVIAFDNSDYQDMSGAGKVTQERFTEVLYVYPNVQFDTPVLYKEMLFDEAKSAFNVQEVGDVLTPGVLQTLFKPWKKQ